MKGEGERRDASTSASRGDPPTAPATAPGGEAPAWLVRLRVPAGFLASAAYVLLARPTLASLAIGIPVVAAGEVVRIWASGSIRKNRELATSGPYAHHRHPLYLGSGLIVLGFAVAGARPVLGLALCASFLALYLTVGRGEERVLAARFGGDFARWREEVPAGFPRLRPWRGRAPAAEENGFSWASVRRHREWRSVLGSSLLVAFLLARALYRGAP